mmetsp:Transcript_39485/g.91674  ORF Transcript_39485/g.91674 Transcript_39485/m.91674 type:complete len:289 (-) Transcript_39485:83-949(-)
MAVPYDHLRNLELALTLMAQTRGWGEEACGGWEFVEVQLQEIRAMSEGSSATPLIEWLLHKSRVLSMDSWSVGIPSMLAIVRAVMIDIEDVTLNDSRTDISEVSMPSTCEDQDGPFISGECVPCARHVPNDLKLQNAIRVMTGFGVWRLAQEAEGFRSLQRSFWALPEWEREAWRRLEVEDFENRKKLEYRRALEDERRFEFHYESLVGVGIPVVGTLADWEVLCQEFNRDGGPKEFDGDLVWGIVAYKTIGPGPKLFGVLDGEAFYHDFGVWTRYQSASYPDVLEEA